ncbi:MAG: glycosyltransferase family 4 protein [Gammaproteobacteria bacterium]
MAGYLVLTELFLPTKGGTAVWFDEVYRRIGDRTTHIVTAAVPGDRDHDRDHPNTVHRLRLARVAWLKPESLGMYLKFFGCALWLALTRRFTAVHAGRALPEGLVALIVARMTGHRVAIYAHGEELTGWGRGAKYRAMCFALRHADTVIANSDFTRDELIRMGVPPARITIINPGVDTERFRPGLPCDDLRAQAGIPAHGALVLSVGRLSRRKGFDRIIAALPALRAAGIDVHYALIGIGEDRTYLESLVRDQGLGTHVHFLGHVAPEDLPRWYNACDVFAMPNREINGDTEGFGMVFIEAAACGKPAIAGIAGGTGSAVVDGVTGYRIDGERVDALVDALSRLVAEPATARQLGEAGYARVVQQFAWPTVAARIASLDGVWPRTFGGQS